MGTEATQDLLGRVIHEFGRKLDQQTALFPKHNRLWEIVRKIHTQQRHDKNKMNSVHALEVEYIAMGKAHKPYEFGVKVGVVSTHKENFIVDMKSFPDTLGHNQRKILRYLALLCTHLGISFDRLLANSLINQRFGRMRKCFSDTAN